MEIVKLLRLVFRGMSVVNGCITDAASQGHPRGHPQVAGKASWNSWVMHCCLQKGGMLCAEASAAAVDRAATSLLNKHRATLCQWFEYINYQMACAPMQSLLCYRAQVHGSIRYTSKPSCCEGCISSKHHNCNDAWPSAILNAMVHAGNL